MKPLHISTKKAAQLLGIGRTLFYSMHSSGEIGPLPIKFGRRSLWNLKELEEWTEAGCPPRTKWQESKE